MEGLTLPWIVAALARLPGRARDLPRALLLAGQAGLGKREASLYLAHALLCEAPREALAACGACASCRLLQAGNHPDLRVIETGQTEEPAQAGAAEDADVPVAGKPPVRQISVDRIRALQDFVTITAHRGGAKVVCLVPAEAMHPAAANALLKMLEEPPGETWFILVSHQPDRLLPTIRSRCFRLPVALPQPGPALQWLAERGVDNAALALAQGGYAPTAAKDLAADEAFWGQRKSLLDMLASGGFDPLRAAELADGADGEVTALLLARWAYDVISLKSGGTVRYHADYAPALRVLADGVTTEAVAAWYDATVQFGRLARHPLNRRLALESLFAGYPGIRA